jgi:hypothetical protein
MTINKRNWASSHDLVRLIKQSLSEGSPVEVEGLGIFLPDGDGGFDFRAYNRPKVFIAYVVEDTAAVDHLALELELQGFDPWVDRQRLVPGQNWPRAIQRAIEVTDYFIACFSSHSVHKRGTFQAELRYALDCATLIPPDDVFLIPVRLNECQLPRVISRAIQYVDLFPDWDSGMGRIVTMIKKQERRRARRPKAA